ncbi:hypothetical protein [Nocardia nepalensis]|uniref:hypothetical protein n=1 Tax=Nocardia nepalensis TaxID=3375448 RepID=UPI003B67880F
MTGPRPALRVRDLAADQAALLRRIHQLAAEGTRLRKNMQATVTDTAARTEALAQIAAVDRDRDLTEIRARAEGMARSWVDLARHVGHAGGTWTGEQLLPTPRPVTGRRTFGRVVADTAQLADIAAITVAREHVLATTGADGEPEPAAAQQVRRNMEAIWTRATMTAASIGMGRKQRVRTFQTATSDIEQRVEHYLQFSVADLDALWRSYTTPTIAADIRRSLNSLRRTDRGTENSTTSTEQPPTPTALIERARNALSATIADRSETGSGTGAAITAAITDALSGTAHGWDSATDIAGGETTAVEAYPDAGPDP